MATQPDAEITVSWDDQLNHGEYRIEYRRSTDTAWTHHATVGYETTSTTIGGLLHGERYDVRVRTQTEDYDGTYQSETIVSQIPTPAPTATATADDTIELAELDPSNNTNEITIERREELDNRRDTGYGEWETIATLEGGTQLHEDSGRLDNWSYEYRVTIQTADDTATSAVVEETTLIDYADRISIEFRRRDGETLYLEPEQLIDPTTDREPNAMSEFSVQVPRAERAEDWHNSEVFMWVEDAAERRLLFRGELTDTSHDGGLTTLSGPDFIKEADRGAAIVEAESELATETIQAFFDEYLPAWDVTVHPANPETVDEGLVVIEADTTTEFDSATSIENTDPFDSSGDEVPLLQSCWVDQGSEDDAAGDFHQIVSEEYTAPSPDDGFGFAAFVNDPGPPGSTGEYVEWTFDIGYDIPEEDVGAWLRFQAPSEYGPPPPIEISLDGTVIDSSVAGATVNSLVWGDVGNNYLNGPGWENGTLAAGQRTIRLEAVDPPAWDSELSYGTNSWVTHDSQYWVPNETTDPGDEPGVSSKWDSWSGSDFGRWIVDRATPIDNSYPYTFDDDPTTGPNGNNHLDGPELYPDLAYLIFDAFNQAFNIEAADLTAVVDAVGDNQALQASIDDGSTWLPATTPGETPIETTAAFGDNEIYGTVVQARVGLSRHSPNGARDETPRFGYAGQTMESFELAIDTNSLAVFDQSEFAGTPFEVLRDMTKEAGKLFTALYEEDSKKVEVFDPGQVVREAEWRVIDEGERSSSSFEYGNSLTVIGARDEQEDKRLTATADAQTEIDERGEIEAPALFESDVDNPERLANIARTRLAEYVNADLLEGDLVATPIDVPPGFAYPVAHLDGQETTLWSAGLERGQTSLDFSEPEDLISAVLSIRTRVRRREI